MPHATAFERVIQRHDCATGIPKHQVHPFSAQALQRDVRSLNFHCHKPCHPGRGLSFELSAKNNRSRRIPFTFSLHKPEKVSRNRPTHSQPASEPLSAFCHLWAASSSCRE